MGYEHKHIALDYNIEPISFLVSSQTLSEPTYTYYACYGITFGSIMSPNCSTPGGDIAPKAVFSGVKQTSTNCSVVTTDDADAPECCTNDPDDCSGVYSNWDDPDSSYVYHSDCIGVNTCNGRATATMDTLNVRPVCDSSKTYLTQTNYMFMEYYCIPGKIVMFNETLFFPLSLSLTFRHLSSNRFFLTLIYQRVVNSFGRN